jgi:hypothetical protein
MKVKERQAIAHRVVHFYAKKTDCNKLETVKHFLREGLKRRTIYDILNRFITRGTADFKPKTGRPLTVSTKNLVTKVKRKLLTTNLSERKIAAKYKTNQTIVHRIKVKNDIKTNKCISAPNYRKNQSKRAKTYCRELYMKSFRKTLIIDDETYVMVDPENIPGQKYFNFIDKSSVSDKLRFKCKEKFPKKYLVWQAMDQKGNVSEPYIKLGTMKAEEYRKECLEKRLLPFILKYHSIGDVLFWPDLATIHYSGSVQKWLKDNGIQFVQKDRNPPNVPHARPIEQFWFLCKHQYGQRSTPPKNLNGFKRIWSNISAGVARSHAQALMKNVRKRLRQIGYNGVFEPLRNKK